eukprot:1223570-Alexandrium_andersonii.AAC.1
MFWMRILSTRLQPRSRLKTQAWGGLGLRALASRSSARRTPHVYFHIVRAACPRTPELCPRSPFASKLATWTWRHRLAFPLAQRTERALWAQRGVGG